MIQVDAIVLASRKAPPAYDSHVPRCTGRLRAAGRPQPMTSARAKRQGRGLRSQRALSTTRALTEVAEAKAVGNRSKRVHRTRINATDAARTALPQVVNYRRHRPRGWQQGATH